jgi:hypothetical protein
MQFLKKRYVPLRMNGDEEHGLHFLHQKIILKANSKGLINKLINMVITDHD